MSKARMTEADVQLILKLRVDEEGNRRSSRAIAQVLRERHGRDFHFTTVHRVMQLHDAERAEITREVVKEKLSGTLCSDLDILEEMIRTQLVTWRAARPLPGKAPAPSEGRIEMTHRDWNSLSRELRESVQLRVKLAGGEPVVEPQDVGWLQSVQGEIYPLAEPEEDAETEPAEEESGAAEAVP